MDILTQQKQDFHHIVSILEFEAESNAHKLFVELTKEGRRSFMTFLNMSRSKLQNLKAIDSNMNALKLDNWEVDKVIKLVNCGRDLRAQKCANFRLQELNKDNFRNHEIRKGVATSRPPVSSLLPPEAAPAHEESALKSYFRSVF